MGDAFEKSFNEADDFDNDFDSSDIVEEFKRQNELQERLDNIDRGEM